MVFLTELFIEFTSLDSILPNREQFTTGIILNVTVTDLGSGPLTDTASLTIVINDKNDNAPRFDVPSYTATLNEDFPTGRLGDINATSISNRNGF